MGKVNFEQGLYNWDKEDNIFNIMQIYADNNYLLLNNNDFEKQILENIKNIDVFTANYGHDSLPPDYYSDSLNCMFDVLRINATEDTQNRKNNPAKKQEREIIKTYERIGIYDKPYMNLLVDVRGEPTFIKYKKQAQRVIGEHISKISIWKQEHPKINIKGLVICDESPLCIEGTQKFGITHFDPDTFRIHETWNDVEFISPIYKSDLDFVVWFNPCKWGSKFIYKYNQNYKPEIEYYPAITIVDTRNPRKRFRYYDYNQLVFV